MDAEASAAPAPQGAVHGNDSPPERSRIVVLAGGTGGAKLARGMLDAVGPERLSVIVNTGDDIEIYGVRVSPDPDLVSFWLADLIDERGWGLHGDTFAVMDGLRALGTDVWFNLGDRDLAWCIERTRLEREGLTPTQAHARLCEQIGVRAQVLPMCDTPLRTIVNGVGLQEFLIAQRAAPRVHAVHFESDQPPRPTPEALAALSQAQAVIVGPSNPVISIGPILEVLRKPLEEVSAPIVCVSPVVAGQIVKGPTALFMGAYDRPISAAGVADYYEALIPGLLDGIVCDEKFKGQIAHLRIDTLMDTPQARANVAEQALQFALSLAE